MATNIPLPALNIRPPAQPTDPLEQFSRLQAIRSSMMGQQLQQQQLQQEQQLAPIRVQGAEQQLESARMENQLKQIDLQNVQKAQEYWTDPSKFQGTGGAAKSAGSGFAENALGIQSDDPLTQHINGMIQAGVNPTMGPNSALAMGKQLLDFRSNVLKQTADQQKVTTDGLATINKILTPIAAENDPVKRSQMLQEASPSLEQASRFDPSIHQAVMMADPNHLDKITTMTGALKDITEYGKAQSEAEKAKAETQTGPFAEAKYRNILSAMSAGQPVSDADLDFAKGYEAANAKTTTQSDTLGVTSTSTSKPSGLAAVGNRQGGKFVAPPSTISGPAAPAATPAAPNTSPQGTKQSIVDLIGQYKMNPQLLSRMMYKHPEMVGLVRQQYPDWDQTSYDAKNKIVQSYTSGPESKSINAISTALGHAGELGQAIDALGNSNGLNMLRSLGNSVGVNVLGNDKVTAFNLIVHRLAPEIASAYIPGGGGEGERGTNAADFAASLGDTQLRSNLGETVKLLRSKISAQEQQWNNTYKPTRPGDDFVTRFLTPGAKDALQKYSPQAGGGGGGTSGGHIIRIGAKRYQYMGSGDTADLKNYTELK